MVLATTIELYDGLVAHGIPGQGRLSLDPDPARYDAVHHHVDVLVIGAGPAGLTAALNAARAGARVALIDEQSEAGGSLLSTAETLDGVPADQWVSRRGRRTRRLPRRAAPAAHHRVRQLRRRVRAGPRAAHRSPRRPGTEKPFPATDLAAPREVDRGRNRRPRAARGVRGQRPARHHARRRGPHLPAPLRGAARPRRGGVHHQRQRLRRRGRPAPCRCPDPRRRRRPTRRVPAPAGRTASDSESPSGPAPSSSAPRVPSGSPMPWSAGSATARSATSRPCPAMCCWSAADGTLRCTCSASPAAGCATTSNWVRSCPTSSSTA